jgi:activator of Hsp90 ATPase-like protein
MPGLMIDREILIEAPADVVWRTIEFTLTPETDERTRLRVTGTGHELTAWPDEEKQRYADEHQGGWAEFLDRLTTLIAKR